MALSETGLANALHDALGQKEDGEGKPTQVSNETQEYASGVVAALKTAVVSLPLVTGTTAPASPLVGGAAVGGVVVVTPAAMISKVSVGADPTALPNIIAEATAVMTYLATGLVSFSSGSITGNCTSTPTSPGPLVLGQANGGTIQGLSGAACLGFVAAALGPLGPDALNHYNALIDYISTEAEVTFPSGSINGVCPPGGGPLGGGVGAGGTIS